VVACWRPRPERQSASAIRASGRAETFIAGEGSRLQLVSRRREHWAGHNWYLNPSWLAR
jgi:hypothetical protein